MLLVAFGIYFLFLCLFYKDLRFKIRIYVCCVFRIYVLSVISVICFSLLYFVCIQLYQCIISVSVL